MRFTSRLVAAAALFCAAWIPAASAGVIYVNSAAAGANNGTTWANAYTSLQTALGASTASDEIWVAANASGYKPHASDRSVSFALKNGVSVYGGFVGTETQRTERDPVAHVTTLSGDVGTPGVATDNSYHVVTADATVTNSARLDGFTVSGGQADGAPNNDRGAGFYNNGGSPLVAGVTFTGNFAAYRGAGARSESGNPRFLACTFTGNSVSFGAGGAGLSTGAGSISIESCIIRSNTISGATTGGGGIQTAGNTTILNTVVAQNSPNGVQIQGGGNTIQDSTITSNNGYGLAFLVSTGNSVSNTIIWNDLVPGIFFDGSSNATVTYSDISGGIGGTGNKNADPAFIAPPADLRPGADSPVVDAGNNTLVPGGTTVDVRGLPRFFDDPEVTDTGVGNVPPGVVDMGAYERIAITVTTPLDVTICSGPSAQFSVAATGQPTLSYRWRKNGTNLNNGGPISGATTETLTISPTVVGDSGDYDVVVTDGFGQSITSQSGTLTVNGRPTAVAGGGGTICTNETIGLGGSGGVGCAWTPTSGLSDPTSCTPTAQPAITTVYNLVVTGANGCASTNAASTTVTVNVTPSAPVITSPISVPVGASGASASVVNHPGSAWTWDLTGGVITAGQGSRQIVFDAASPGTTMTCTVFEDAGGCESPVSTTHIQVDFLDMPPTNAFHDYVVKVARNGVTAGCGFGNYCGQNPITRAQMAVFLLKAKLGSNFVPPPATGTVFTDVPANSFAAAWIEHLASLGVTGGCGGTSYCPSNPVTRAQMAIFLLKALNDSSYNPPPATGTIFADVPAGAFAAAWIENLYSLNITGGCITNPLRYCPNNTNNRQQMAVFMTKTFQLP